MKLKLLGKGPFFNSFNSVNLSPKNKEIDTFNTNLDDKFKKTGKDFFSLNSTGFTYKPPVKPIINSNISNRSNISNINTKNENIKKRYSISSQGIRLKKNIPKKITIISKLIPNNKMNRTLNDSYVNDEIRDNNGDIDISKNSEEIVRKLTLWDDEHLNLTEDKLNYLRGREINSLRKVTGSNYSYLFNKGIKNPSETRKEIETFINNIGVRTLNTLDEEQKKNLLLKIKLMDGNENFDILKNIGTFNFSVFDNKTKLIPEKEKKTKLKTDSRKSKLDKKIINIENQIKFTELIVSQPELQNDFRPASAISDLYSNMENIVTKDIENAKTDMINDKINREYAYRMELIELYQKIMLIKLKKKSYKDLAIEAWMKLNEAKKENQLICDNFQKQIVLINNYFGQKDNNINKENNEESNENSIQDCNDKGNSIFKITENENEINALGLSNEHSKSKIFSNDDNNISNNGISKLNTNNIINNESMTILRSLTKTKSQGLSTMIKDKLNEGQSNKICKEKGISKDKNKKIKDAKGNMETIEDKMRKYSEYASIMNEINIEKKRHDEKYNKVINELNEMVDKANKKLDELEKEHIKLKVKYNDEIFDQKNYYLDILKVGMDTRKEGLSWVVTRLLELNTSLERKYFPSFLDDHQIDFLITKAKLNFEGTQCKLLLQTLKKRQVNKFNTSAQKKLDKIVKKNEDEKKNAKDNVIFNQKFDGKLFSNKYMKQFEHNYQHYQTPFKYSVTSKIEDLEVQIIINALKKRISKFTNNLKINDNKTPTSNSTKQKVAKLINNKGGNSEYYSDLLLLRKRIEEIDEFIKKLIKEESVIFQEKFQGVKATRAFRDNIYEKVYRALFGNCLVI